MKSRRYYPKKEKKQDYSKLFTNTEKAKLLYFESHEFRMFVYAHDDNHTNIPLEQLYEMYNEGSLQLSLF